ncbi:MAG: enoyl-CoA hydratase-related protein [Jatrophihabitans sp.]|uniref:enoyl-CoA hydratase-related protein n=1 Tax=Jatrophihabitans sp. TaxID=1932789 RepID=UPI003F7D41EF
MVDLTRSDAVHVLTLGADENRFTPAWMTAVHDALDEVERAATPLVTVAEGKCWSNGLDLDWMLANPAETTAYVGRVQDLFARVLTLPVPTVAAVSGHAFGAGAMLALAHDFRFMRADRGFFCLPEVDIDIPFSPGMAALVQGKLTPAAAVASMTTGTRFGGEDAVVAGLVDAATSLDELLPAAVARAATLAGKNLATLGAIKTTMYGSIVAILRDAGAVG